MVQPYASRVIAKEPQWRPESEMTSAQLPAALRYWLLDDGSLTRRLVEHGHGQFTVRRLHQSWQVPLFSERKLLQTSPRQLALIREVTLQLAGHSVVFARSVFPISSLGGQLAHLRKLQNRSLGSILFQHPSMHRSPFEIAHMAGDCDYLPGALQQAGAAWGRRSRFTIAGKGLMVSEVFLQGFKPWPQSLPVHRSQRGTVSTAHLPTKSVS